MSIEKVSEKVLEENQFILNVSRRKYIIVQPEIAEIIGLLESVIFNQIKYLTDSEFNNNIHNGLKWVTKTYEEWHKEIKFCSVNSIRRAIKELISRELILVRTINKFPGDRTLSYAINYYKASDLPCDQNEHMHDMHVSKLDNSDLPKLDTSTLCDKDLKEDNNKDVVVPLENCNEKWEQIKSTMLWHGLTVDFIFKCKENYSLDYLLEKIEYTERTIKTKRPGYLRKAIEDDYRDGVFVNKNSERKIFTLHENTEWYLNLDDDTRSQIHAKVCNEWSVFRYMYENDIDDAMKGDNLVQHSSFKDVMRICGRPQQ